MSNGIGRLRTLGIASQDVFNTPAVAPTFSVPLVNAPVMEPTVNKEENFSVLGSSYTTNLVANANRYGTFPFEVKVDEDLVPLFFKQRFDIATSAVVGETTVYEQTMTYTNNTNCWYTLFLEDDKRVSYIMQDCLFSELTVGIEPGFVILTGTATGSYPIETAVTNTILQPKDFLSRQVAFSYGKYSETIDPVGVLTAQLAHTFGLSTEDENFDLGNQDMAFQELTEDVFETTITLREADRDMFDSYTVNDKIAYIFDMKANDRFVTGSVLNTNPSIIFEYPVGFYMGWSEPDNSPTGLVKQEALLRPVDEVGVADAPLKITVINGIASY